jgi:hypothetical protein
LRKAVHNFVEKCSQGRSKVADDVRPSSPFEIATQATVQRVEELIRDDRRITTDGVATAQWFSIQNNALSYRDIGFSDFVHRQNPIVST